MPKSCSQCDRRLSFRNSFVWENQPICKSCLDFLERGITHNNLENEQIQTKILQKPFIKFLAMFIFPIIIALIANFIESSIYNNSYDKVYSKIFRLRMNSLANAFNQGIEDVSKGKSDGQGLINGIANSQSGNDLAKEQEKLWSDWEKNNKILILFHKYHISAIIFLIISFVLIQLFYRKQRFSNAIQSN